MVIEPWWWQCANNLMIWRRLGDFQFHHQQESGEMRKRKRPIPPPIPGTRRLCRLWPPQASCEGGWSDGLVGMGECCVTCGHITYAPLPRRRPQAWLHTEWTWTRIAWGCPQITPLHIGDSTSGNLARRHLGWARGRQGWLHCSSNSSGGIPVDADCAETTQATQTLLCIIELPIIGFR